MSTTRSKKNAFTWPDDQLDPIMLAKLNDRISVFMSNSTELADIEGSLEVKKLSIDLYKIWRGSADTSTEEELLVKGANWDTEEPKLAQIQKYLNRLLSGKHQEASDYFEKSVEHKKSIISEGLDQAKSQAGTDRVNKKHGPNNRTKAKAIEFYKINKDDYVSKTQAAHDLEIRFPPLKAETYYKALTKL